MRRIAADAFKKYTKRKIIWRYVVNKRPTRVNSRSKFTVNLISLQLCTCKCIFHLKQVKLYVDTCYCVLCKFPTRYIFHGSHGTKQNEWSRNLTSIMVASLGQLGCYSNLHEWTRPSNLCPHLEKLTPLQTDLLASAVENLATALVTFGLVEHMTYTQ